VLDNAEALLGGCDCSTSCDKCLRHYGNWFHHASLDRHLALELISYVKSGGAPATFDFARQRAVLEPLAQLLTLAGWSIAHEGPSPLTAARAGRQTNVWAVPSLVDPRAIGVGLSQGDAVFTPYELSRDLPGAYAEIT
jgi:hypothetical protein